MMAIALAMARRGLGRTAPNPSVGAVVVAPDTGEVLARAVTAPGGRPHAEPQALEMAGARARGATLYVTLEPCSHHGRTAPCADSVIAAGIARCVVAIEDPDPRVAGRGIDRMRRAGIAVARGVLAERAHWLARGHVVRVTERRPFVVLKIALGADGSVPRGARGAPTFVTGPLARAYGHLMRAETDAILVGRGTVHDDDPQLTCRLPGLEERSPMRLVLASLGSGLASSALVRSARVVPVHVFVGGESAPGLEELADAGVHVHPQRLVAGRLWLPSVLEALAEMGVTRLLVEGGPGIWQSFARHGLYDEVALFHVRGGGASVSDAAAFHALGRVAHLSGLQVVSRRALEGDDLIILRPAQPRIRLATARSGPDAPTMPTTTPGGP